jgi:pyruvate formate lyase activating enzyme
MKRPIAALLPVMLPAGPEAQPGTDGSDTGTTPAARIGAHWHALPDGRVGCDLCYRQCELAPGEAGWCRIRHNDGGTLIAGKHGEIGWLSRRGSWFGTFSHRKPILAVGGISCTSGCSFCISREMTLHPERLRAMPSPVESDIGWKLVTVNQTPADVIARARAGRCRSLRLTMNEPTLTIEYSRDLAELARAAGLYVILDTNGFTLPAAILDLAPFIDAVYIGIKGSAAPWFYEMHMRAAGAVPHVYRAMETWRSTPVTLAISDLLTPPAWLADDEQAAQEQSDLYRWIAAHLGRDVSLDVWPIVSPKAYARTAILSSDDKASERRKYKRRIERAVEIARTAGLRHVTDCTWVRL